MYEVYVLSGKSVWNPENKRYNSPTWAECPNFTEECKTIIEDIIVIQ